MKLSILVFSSVLTLASCSQHENQINQLQAQIDSLKKQSKNNYTPGFGELMSNIQLHHAKLWFAGDNRNWELAKYQESLILSAFKKIQKFHGNDPEAKIAAMITPAMDSVDQAIESKNLIAFRQSFLFLNASCNGCHQATKRSFNVIVTPTVPPITNQLYK
jgi:hypothetical protein